MHGHLLCPVSTPCKVVYAKGMMRHERPEPDLDQMSLRRIVTSPEKALRDGAAFLRDGFIQGCSGDKV
jgi:hypothetical protein